MPDPREARLGRSVSLDQAAELLTVSRRTIYNYIRAGRLQTIHARGSQRVLKASLAACVRGKTSVSAAVVEELIAREADVALPFSESAG